MKEPDFYLSSADYYNVAMPRRVWCLKRMSGLGRDDLLLARVDPPITDDAIDVHRRNIDIVVLATRHVGTSLFPLRPCPVSVYVLHPLIDNVEARDELKREEVRNIAWAELYKTEEEAQRMRLPDGPT
jgi:hypothetical protein